MSQSLGGRYQVVRCLGSGHLWTSYLCRNAELDGSLIVVKVLHPGLVDDDRTVTQFRDTVFASYGVSHPNLIRVYEYSRDKDVVQFTCEYVEGRSLAELLSEEVRMSEDNALSLLEEMVAGLGALHDAGLFHCALKPENILIGKDGSVKLSDYCFTNLSIESPADEHGGVIGDINYASPEFILRHHFDARSDIYALGVVAYEMVTGGVPFKAQTVYDTLTMRLKEDPPSPRSLAPGISSFFEDFILKALAREPEARFQNMDEVKQALDEIKSLKLH
ncbi:MAG: serine/threonine protein kinase [Bdellovibrionales bacterium]|nr:serine/threonine protein kinase [Bdellovibrionales bacterium]